MDTKTSIILICIVLLLFLFTSSSLYNSLSGLFQNMKRLYQPGKKTFSIRQFESPSMSPSYSQSIPLLLFQTGTYPVSPEIRQASLINRNINPEYEYRFYNDTTDRIDYITKYEPSLLPTYNALLPGAYKADLFRYVVLYYEGGVYLDDKSTIIQPLRTFIHPSKEFIAFRDVTPAACFNGFIAVVPKHPIMRQVIDRIKRNVKKKNYGINALDPTGPQLLGRCVNSYLNRPEMELFEEKEYPKQIDFIGTYYILNKEYQSLSDRDGTPLIHRCHNGYYKLPQVITKSYVTKWLTGNGIYAS